VRLYITAKVVLMIGQRRFPYIYRVLQKELNNGIPNVAEWRVLQKHLHFKAYRLSIV
jgi:hypothetical protein